MPLTRPLTLTCLPGAAGSAAFWTPLMQQLPADWQVRPMDLPGLGSVPARPDVNSYDDLVEHVASTIDAPTVLVAQSMGAYVALELALTHPQLVTHLVLAAATSGVDVLRHGAADWRADYAATHPQAQPWARAHLPDLTDRLAAIEVPVLLVWATRDALSPLPVAHTLASRLPSSSLITFDSDDHWVVHGFAAEVATALRTFLEASR